MMDTHVIGLIAILVVVCILSLVISRFLPRSKTYEEAQAEKQKFADKLYGGNSGGSTTRNQRKTKQNNNAAGSGGKQSENKRDKKAAAKEMKRRAKEEQIEAESDAISEETQSTENSPKHEQPSAPKRQHHPHVEFSDNDFVIVAGTTIGNAADIATINTAGDTNRNKSAKRNRRPSGILLNKNEQLIMATAPANASAQLNVGSVANSSDSGTTIESINHFEESHPKDDVEIKKLLKKKAGITKKDLSLSPKVNRIDSPKKEKFNKSNGNRKQIANNNNNANQHNIHVSGGELGGDEQLTIVQLMHSLQRADLAPNEIQDIIDYLLDKQQDTVVRHSDWSDDVVQKLKKQLGEKDKLLSDEQEAVASLQSKLRELVVEKKNYHEELQHYRNESTALKNDMFKILETNKLLSAQYQQVQKTVLDEKKMDAEQAHTQLMQLQEMKVCLENELQAHKSKEASKTEEWERQYRMMKHENEKKDMLLKQAELTNNELMKASRHEYKVELLNLSNALRSAKEEANAINQEYQSHRMESSAKVADLEVQLQQQVATSDKNVKLSAHFEEVCEKLLVEVNDTIADRGNQLADYNNQLQQMKKVEETLHKEIAEYKQKNNELIKKNWKLAEALNPPKSETDATKKNDKEWQHRVLKLFDEMRPEETVLQSKESFGEWYDEFFKRTLAEINSTVTTKSKQQGNNQKEETASVPTISLIPQPSSAETEALKLENEKLYAKVLEFERVLVETEHLLVNIQEKYVNEEMRWKVIVEAKNAEILTLQHKKDEKDEKI